jgi:hypothetical protein
MKYDMMMIAMQALEMDEDRAAVWAHSQMQERAYDNILVILTRMKPLVRSSIFTVIGLMVR